MLNVLYIFGGEKASGAEKVIERLVNVNSAKVNAHLFISPGTLADNLRDDSQNSFTQITIHHELKKLNRSKANKAIFYLLAIKNSLLLSYKTLRYIHKNQIHTVHANTIVPAFYLLSAIWVSRLFKIQVKWIWSDHDLKYFTSFDHKLSVLCVNAFDLTLVVSEAVKGKYQNHCNKIIILYNGLDLNLFKHDQQLREKFRYNMNISPEKIIIGLAGTIQKRKGQLELINSFLILQNEFPNSILLLAGAESSDYPEYVQEVLSVVKQNENILYLGKINDMLSYYNACDIVINNSNSEGSEALGTTIYEAMSCQRIVIASRTGGTPEIIDDKINGYLFSPDIEDDLHLSLKNILSEFNNQQDLTRNARLKVKDRFDINMMKEKYNNLLIFSQAI